MARRSAGRLQPMPFAGMDIAGGCASAAGLSATLAMGMGMPLALLGACPAQVGTQRAEVTVVLGLTRKRAQRRLADVGAIQVEQGTGLQSAVAGTDTGVRALAGGEQRLGAGPHAGIQVFRRGGHGASLGRSGGDRMSATDIPRPASADDHYSNLLVLIRHSGEAGRRVTKG